VRQTVVGKIQLPQDVLTSEYYGNYITKFCLDVNRFKILQICNVTVKGHGSWDHAYHCRRCLL